MLVKLRFLLIFSLSSCLAEELYKGYKIYEVVPHNDDQLNCLGKLSEEHREFDFLNDIIMINGSSRIVTSPSNVQILENFLQKKSLSFVVVDDDLSETIKNENPVLTRNPRSLRINSKISFNKYHHFRDINIYLEKLAKEYPSYVTLEQIGDSFEGRKMKVIRISNGLYDRRSPKKTIFIDAGIHGREWIAPATALYVIHQLVENQDANRDLLLGYDWIILPVGNPDGYEYTFNKERLWRKTRSSNLNKDCPGTDANRNFAFRWGLGKDKKDPCSEIYPGPKPFSEVETQRLRAYILKIKESCKMYISLHSFGRFIFFPWSWDAVGTVPNFEQQQSVAMAGKNAAQNEYNQRYMIGSPGKIFKRISGSSMDWVYGYAHIPVVMTIELPAGGKGFDPPPKDIKSIVNEGWAIIKAMAKKTKEIFH